MFVLLLWNEAAKYYALTDWSQNLFTRQAPTHQLSHSTLNRHLFEIVTDLIFNW